jgi:hypothetical protein
MYTRAFMHTLHVKSDALQIRYLWYNDLSVYDGSDELKSDILEVRSYLHDAGCQEAEQGSDVGW